MNRIFRPWWIGAACLAVYACSSDSIIPESPESPQAPFVAEVRVLGNAQNGVVGVPLAEEVGVRLLDQYGASLPGILVGFAVDADAGSVTETSVSTDALGEARTAWTLGTLTSVDYRVHLSIPGYTGTTPDIRASALAGPPATITAESGDSQSGMIGMELGDPLRVRVTDAYSNPVSGVPVVWQATGGWVSADTTRTDYWGLTEVVRTLGAAPGTQGTTANMTGASLPSISFTSTAGPLVSAYDIDVRFVGAVAPAVETAVRAAAARWSRIIVGDVPSASPSASWDYCGNDPSLLPATVDDILIIVEVGDSVGTPGGYLGGGYPCIDRPSLLTQVGRIWIDGADVAALEADGLLDALVMRAIGQAIGFGSLWPYHTPALAVGSMALGPEFVGPRAVRQFNLNRGTLPPRTSVPIEPSTDPWDWTWALPGEYPYWREGVMGRELMTLVLNPGANLLSTITVATFADMGYTVSYAAADPYTVAFGTSATTELPGASASPTRGNSLEQALIARRRQSAH